MHVPANKWATFFQNLYDDSVQGTPIGDLRNLPIWSPVSPREIKDHIGRLKIGKAPGSDGIPPEVLKENADWWAHYLAELFTFIDQSGRIPKQWGMAIVVPIYKKGDKKDPANYRPISLLNVISKLYTRHLLEKLELWLEQEECIPLEQAGFRGGRVTMEHCLILQQLIEKYASKGPISLYAAFIDLKAAFDSISRQRLWQKLGSSSIDKRLLYLIQALHQETYLKVRCNPQGLLTNSIKTSKGVRQGCLLAPTLFIYYISNMVKHMSDLKFHPPKLASRHLPILIYADDTVILSRSPVGLQRALDSFTAYCDKEHLTINCDKTKVMAFGRRPKIRSWLIKGKKVEQVHKFTYLGVIVQESGANNAHCNWRAEKAEQSANAIVRFFRTKGGLFVPAALRLYQHKVVAQLLYGTYTGISLADLAVLEKVQSKFFRSILQVPPGVPNALIRLELGQMKLEARILIASVCQWLKSFSEQKGLLPLINQDPFQPRWILTLKRKLEAMGLSIDDLLVQSTTQAKALIKQRIQDIERQRDIAQSPLFRAPMETRYVMRMANYLSQLEEPAYRRAFTLARCSVIPSMVLEGRYKKIPYEDRCCMCSQREVESMVHMFFCCPLHNFYRERLIHPCLDRLTVDPNEMGLERLLSDENSFITKQIAKFCLYLIKFHSKKVG